MEGFTVKKLLFLLLFVSVGFAQKKDSLDAITSKAIEGGRLLHSGMRDPDSFKIDKVWVMHSEKHGDAICYTYYARNGFGGMNHSAADYAPNKTGNYRLNPASYDYDGPKGNIHAPFPGGFEYFSRCGQRAEKGDTYVGDVTADVKSAMDNAKP
jgi:hypothetical protein